MTRQERFAAKYQEHPSRGCWLWTGAKNNIGYALFWNGRIMGAAHKWAYQNFRGFVPDGLDLDHLCRTRHCVNPWHLEPVTRSENVRRGMGNKHKHKTHCKRGHPLSGDNLYLILKDGRACQECGRMHWRNWRRKKHEPLAGSGLMTDWQPIETAPKNGTWILLDGCEYGYRMRVARWFHWQEQGYDWGDYSHRGFKPKRWRPLPND